MKILTADQMRRVDRLTTEQVGIPSLTLMENAGRQVAEFLTLTWPEAKKVTILCGKGNNGGDGFVTARILAEKGIRPKVALLSKPAGLRGDAAINYERLVKSGQDVVTILSASDWEQCREGLLDCEVLVDAMLGTGLSGPARELFERVISTVNAAAGAFMVLALDIPSGLDSDSGELRGASIGADNTVTFTAPKRGQLFPPGCEKVGTLLVAPIGSPEELYAEVDDLFLNLITCRDFAGLPFERPIDSHKGDYGHVLLVAGSRGKSGAAALAGKAALRAGAGLVTIATPESTLPVVAGFAPEYMTEPLAETDQGTVSTNAFNFGHFDELVDGKNIMAIGPGMTTHPETVDFVRRALRETTLPVVVDADGLNALVGAMEVLKERKDRVTVLTPHPGEMARLTGATSADVQGQRVDVAREFAQEFSVYLVLKGYRTLIATPSGQVFVNPTGGPALAKGGSGDVLTGLMAGMMAQFAASPIETVISLAVYLHGLTGDFAGSSESMQHTLASDLIMMTEGAWEEIRETLGSYDPDLPYIVAGRKY